MTLPLSRNTTYTAGAQVKSTDLNDLQDAVINGRHGLITIRIPASLGTPQSNAVAWSFDAGGVAGTPFPQWTVPIPVVQGDRIVAVRARMQDSATGPTKLSLITTKSVDTTETGFGGSAVLSAGTGAWQTLTKSAVNETVVAGTSYYATLLLNTGTAACHLQWIEVDIDHS
jgi:hypothetical protein